MTTTYCVFVQRLPIRLSWCFVEFFNNVLRAVTIYNATGGLARFEDRKKIFYFEERSHLFVLTGH
jgi:hypothetical protein